MPLPTLNGYDWSIVNAFARANGRRIKGATMDDIRWHKLTSRFPLVPADFKIERVQQRADRGTPLHGGNRPVLTLAFSPDATRIAASGGRLNPRRT